VADQLKLRILLETDAAGAQRGLGAFTGSVTSAEKRVTQSLQRMNTAFGSLTTGQKVLAGVGIGVGLLATGLGAVLRPAIQFESAFAGVKKTVDGTPAQLGRIRSELLGLSTIMPTSANDLADIAANAGQLGVKAPDIIKFTKTIAQLGETTDLSFEEASQSLARFLNVTGGGAKNIGKVADVIVELGNNSATTESQIVDFSLRLASAFTVAGAAEDEILALASSFSSLGIRSEAGGSALSKIITVISDAAINGGKELQTLADTAGLLPAEFAEIARTNPVEALILFGEGLGEAIRQGKSITGVLKELKIDGLRTSEVLRLLALNSGFVREQLALASNAYTVGGQAAEEYNKRLETVAAKLSTLKNQFTALAITIGSPALGLFASGIDLARDAITQLVTILGPAAKQLGTFLGNLAVGALQIVGAFAGAGGAVDALVIVLSALSAVTETVFGAINLLPPAVIAAAAALALLARGSLLTTATSLGQLAVNAALSGNALGVLRGSTTGLGGSLATLGAGINPVTAAMVALGAAFLLAAQAARSIEKDASAANESLVKMLSEGVSEQKAAATVQAVSSIEAEIASLNAEIRDAEGSGFVERWFNSVVAGATSIGGENRDLKVAQERVEQLNEELDKDNAARFAGRIEYLADQLGVSKLAVEGAVDATGNYNALLQGTTTELLDVQAVLAEYIENLKLSNDVQKETIDNLLEGNPTIADYADLLGVSAASIENLAAITEGVDLTSLFSEDLEARGEALSAISAELLSVIAPMAEAWYDVESASQGQIDTMLEQIRTTYDLIGATSELQSAIEAANDVRAAAAFIQEQLTEAQVSYNAAAEAFDSERNRENFVALTQSMYDLTVAQAAAGASADELQAIQANNVLTLLDLGASAGLSRQEILDLVAAQGLVSETTLANIITNAAEAKADVEAYLSEQKKIEREIIVDALLVDKTADERAALDAFISGWDGRVARALTELDDNSGPTRENLDAFMTGWDARVARATTEVDTSSADAELARMLALLDEVDSTQVDALASIDAAPFDADASEIRSELTQIDQIEAIPTVGADITSALAKVGQAGAAADAYAGDDYTAQLTADASNAKAERIGLIALLTAYKFADYTAQITADPARAIAATNAARALATIYARTYTAELRAIDRASGVINSVINRLGSFRSKTVTLTTVSRSVTRNADGGVWDGQGRPWGSFADGGFNLPAGTTIERPGQAKIYSAAPVGRFFAEPETGGEAYIPLGLGKRGPALDVFSQVGQILGVFANGGVTGTVGRSADVLTARANVRLDVAIPIEINAAPGMDESRLAEEVGRKVDDALDRVARDLGNQLVGS
jgi:TP901 family phage tail tape measure protein